MDREHWAVFDEAAVDYDAWYDRHPDLYAAELDAVDRAFGEAYGGSVEVGIGSGRFAAVLGIDVGVDRSPRMVALATGRGCRAVVADAGRLPFGDRTSTTVAFLTVLCFLPDPLGALREAWRVTRPGGRVVVGFLNRLGPAGVALEAGRAASPYYADATFISAPELEALLRRAGFEPEASWQVVEDAGTYAVAPGADRGPYGVVRARRVGRAA